AVTASTSAFTMPAAPTGLTASAKPGGGVSLAFTNRSSGQAGFAVYRKMSGDASFAAIGETVSETYFDAAAPAGATLVYAVAAFTTDGEGPPGVPALVDTAPVAPSDLSVTPIDETSVLVEWTPAGGGEQMIFRSRAEDDGGFLPIATLPAGASSIVDAELHECERATWIVRMYAGEAYDESPWVESRALPMAPAAFEAIPDAGGVGLTWTDMSDGEMGYVVERATDGGAFEEIAALGENAQAYTDDPHAGAHVYRVAAFHEYGKAYSGEDSVVEDGAATDDDGPDDDGEDDDDAADDDDDFAERDEDDDSGCGC
ncbi:fibronectin type III domain-containing protein, partial [bacterium]|nr:fibronectin type III domain-containing protein [bacterium]